MAKPNLQISEQLSTQRGFQINWNQVYYFSEVASFGSLKDASLKLNLHPSTLSEHITQLEKDLKVQLFLREHRKLTLTPEGNRLYLRAKEMFEAGQRLVEAVSPLPLSCYPVSIGLVPTPSIQLAYKVIGDYLHGNSALNMKLVHADYSELALGISKGVYDFGFSDRIPEQKDISNRLISSSFIKFYVSEKWTGARFLELLKSLPLLICNAEPATRTIAEQSLIDTGMSPSSVVTSDYPSVLVDLCQRGLGIGVFSEETIKTTTDTLKSFRVPKDAPKLMDNLYILWAKEGEKRTAIRTLLMLLDQVSN